MRRRGLALLPAGDLLVERLGDVGDEQPVPDLVDLVREGVRG